MTPDMSGTCDKGWGGWGVEDVGFARWKGGGFEG